MPQGIFLLLFFMAVIDENRKRIVSHRRIPRQIQQPKNKAMNNKYNVVLRNCQTIKNDKSESLHIATDTLFIQLTVEKGNE